MDAYDIEDMTDVLCDRVVNRWDDFGIQDEKGAYARADRRLKRSDVEWHILGGLTVGAYQLNPDSLVKWIMYDVDAHDGSATSEVKLKVLKKELERKSIPFYDELSGSPGSHHLWVFLEEATPAEIAYNWARCAVISKSGYAVFRGEVFPKQMSLAPDKPFGNLVKVPCGKNRRNGNWSRFVDDIFVDYIKTVDLSNWEVIPYPDFRKGRGTQTTQWRSGPSAHFQGTSLLAYADVRPCLLKFVELGLPMGHVLRRCICMEYQAVTNLSERDIANLFETQPNYSWSRAMQQVVSLRGYNRPRCESIREGAECLKVYGIDIRTMCDKCVTRR